MRLVFALGLTAVAMLLVAPASSRGDTTVATPPPGSKDDSWSITYEHFVEGDAGNGVSLGTTVTRFVFSRQGVDITVTTTLPKGRSKQTHQHENLAPARRDALVALIPEILSRSGTYAFTEFVPDEGSDEESLLVKVGGRQCSILLRGGRGIPYPPPPVVALYNAITGRRAETR